MKNRHNGIRFRRTASIGAAILLGIICFSGIPLAAQNDPAEPLQGKPNPKISPRPAGAVMRREVDENSMRGLIGRMVACGTRSSLSSWDDPKRGAGCGRDQIVARLNEIAGGSGEKLQVVVDKFETTSARTNNKPVHMENVYAILPGSDPVLSKTVFIISGHFDSRATDVMNPNLDAPGADDDASRSGGEPGMRATSESRGSRGARTLSCHDTICGDFG